MLEQTDLLQGILLRVERDLYEFTARPDPLPGCKWVLASAMQKAVRRGEIDTALRAGISLWGLDRQSFWRRLHVTALEDIGPADTDVLTKVLTVTAATAWRKRVGDLKSGLYLISLMCRAFKSRLAEQVFTCGELSPQYAPIRLNLAKASDEVLTQRTLDTSLPLTERALSLRYLAGTTRFPSDSIPQRNGSLESAVRAMRSLDAPTDLVTACLGVLTKTQWPLALLLPLLWADYQHHTNLTLHTASLPSSPQIEGIPMYAADTFTRVGKTCIRQLQTAILDLKQFSTTQIGLGVFYLEGGKLTNEPTNALLDEFKQVGEVADIEASGLCLARYLGLRDCLRANWQEFEDIRHTGLKKYLQDWRIEQEFDGGLI